MKKTLTIIVPSYNMEKYISQNIKSLLIPSLNDIEVLVINDGSNDKTYDIANKYAQEYPESIRVINKENGHYGSCINRGLKEATGKYVKILDCDDSFDSENFEGFVQFLKNIDADMVFSNYCVINENGKITRNVEYPKPYKAKEMSFEEALPIIKFRTIAMHAITYSLHLLKTINYKQTEGVIYTDKEWDFMPFLHVRTIAAYPHCVYRYMIGREGQSTSPEVVMKSENISFKLLIRRIDYFNEYKDKLSSTKKETALDQLGLGISVVYYRNILQSSNTDRINNLKCFDAELQTKSNEVYDYLANIRIWKCIPFIKYWRKNNQLSLVILFVLRLFNRFKK